MDIPYKNEPVYSQNKDLFDEQFFLHVDFV